MNEKHDGDYRGFIKRERSWNGKSNLKNSDINEIIFGLYSPQGGTSGEMTVRWNWLGNEFIPELSVYSDTWSALSTMHDLIDVLGKHDSENPSPEEFCNYLIQCGFSDLD